MVEHDIIESSTAQYPSDNGWIHYYCATCKESLCARSYPSFEAWGDALAEFNKKHPHTSVRVSRWAQ